MGFWKDITQTAKIHAAKSRAQEASLYELVANELEHGLGDKGIWAKSIAECDGDESKAKAKYLKLRVQALRDEIAILDDAQAQVKSAAARRLEDDAKERKRYERLLELSKKCDGYGKLKSG